MYMMIAHSIISLTSAYLIAVDEPSNERKENTPLANIDAISKDTTGEWFDYKRKS